VREKATAGPSLRLSPSGRRRGGPGAQADRRDRGGDLVEGPHNYLGRAVISRRAQCTACSLNRQPRGQRPRVSAPSVLTSSDAPAARHACASSPSSTTARRSGAPSRACTSGPTPSPSVPHELRPDVPTASTSPGEPPRVPVHGAHTPAPDVGTTFPCAFSGRREHRFAQRAACCFRVPEHPVPFPRTPICTS
jgi:hypothetical protein